MSESDVRIWRPKSIPALNGMKRYIIEIKFSRYRDQQLQLD